MSSKSTQIIGGGGTDGRNHANVTDDNRLMVDTGATASSDSPAIDAFGRSRVSDPVTIFDSVSAYDKQPLLWYEKLAGTGSSTHLPAEAAVRMRVAANADKVTRQTRSYHRYQPGKSQMILTTWVMGTADAGVRRRVGYFDDANGIFLEEVNGALWIVLRSSTSGVAVDTRVAQADWNNDAYASLDVTRTQILVIDLQWLGVGRVRVGFNTDGLTVYAHEFDNANAKAEVYMTTATLPVRYEIEATAVIAGNFDFNAICASVISEGGQDDQNGFPFSAGSGVPQGVSGTAVPLLSIRPAATFKGRVNRAEIITRVIQVLNTGNGTALVSLIYGGTLTGAAFVSLDAESVVEHDTTATALSGGRSVASFYVDATNQSSSSQTAGLTAKLPLTLDIDGANPTNLTLVVTNVGTVTMAASFNWQEYR